jgi:protein-tyrosine-phosphatase
LLRKYLGPGYEREVEIVSAGLVEQLQQKADQRAKAAAEELDISLDHHRPQKLTPHLVESADVIFLMDRLNEARILAEYPGVERKTFLLGSVDDDGRRRSVEICDPGLGGLAEVRSCYLQLDTRVRKLADMLVSTLVDRDSRGAQLNMTCGKPNPVC